MAAAAPPGRLQRALLAPLSLASTLAAPQLQPLRTAAASAGHLALAMRGGRALYVFDGPLPTTGRGAQAVLLCSHSASPVCALAYVERARSVFLVALQVRETRCAPPRHTRSPRPQEDAGVAVWVRDASKRTGEWRPLAAAEAYAAGPPLALPPAAGHRGDVRSACVCAHSPRFAPPVGDEAAAPAPRSAVDLAWLLHSRDGGRTELLVRVVPLAADTLPAEARGAAQRACPVERLGKYADATRLLCAGGSDLWVWTAAGVAYRWCLHLRRCLARVDVAAACGRPLRPSATAPVPTLHHPTRELLALCADGAVLAVSPALRPAAARDDGFAGGQLRVAVRLVGTLEHMATSGAAHDIAAQGSLLFVLRANVMAQVVGVARNPFMLSVHHAPTGTQLSLAELPALGAPSAAQPGAPAAPPAAGLLSAHGAGGTFLWMGGTVASCVALLVPDACAALAALADPEEHEAAPPHLTAVSNESAGASRAASAKLLAIAALLGEASSWGGSLERCEAALAVTLTQAALRASCAPGTDEYAALLAAAAERSRAGLWGTDLDSDKLLAAVHPVLRSLVALQPLLYAAASDSPVVAMAATQAADAIREVYSPAPGSTSAVSALEAFRVYTPLAAAIAPLAVTALQSQSSPAAQKDTGTPAWVWGALLDSRRADKPSRAPVFDGRREWARAGTRVRSFSLLLTPATADTPCPPNSLLMLRRATASRSATLRRQQPSRCSPSCSAPRFRASAHRLAACAITARSRLTSWMPRQPSAPRCWPTPSRALWRQTWPHLQGCGTWKPCGSSSRRLTHCLCRQAPTRCRRSKPRASALRRRHPARCPSSCAPRLCSLLLPPRATTRRTRLLRRSRCSWRSARCTCCSLPSEAQSCRSTPAAPRCALPCARMQSCCAWRAAQLPACGWRCIRQTPPTASRTGPRRCACWRRSAPSAAATRGKRRCLRCPSCSRCWR
jgi:hypothetical protein